MKVNRKSGITVTSIVVYVILFFIFTTATTVISSRFNESLFDDRGRAINITAINKLQYNLLNSANNSYIVEGVVDGNKTTLTFSNSDIYIFDLDSKMVYKNGGKLVKYVKDCDVKLLDDVVNIDITLNKYTNEVNRNIKISVPTADYISNGLIAHYDGINNTGKNEHSNSIMTWNDISESNVTATLSNSFTHDGVTNGWVEDGLLFPMSTSINEYNSDGIYDTNAYSSMTFEIVMTPVTVLGTSGTDYVYPLRLYNTAGTSITLQIGTRKNVSLMYGEGHNTVFSTGISVNQGNKYTLTFVQNALTSRSIYINGSLKQSTTISELTEIDFSRVKITSHTKGGYIIHSVRIYNRVLSEDEILSNYNKDVIRFGV